MPHSLLRRAVKTGVACALSWSGAAVLGDRLLRTDRAPVVLGYHRVVDSPAAEAPHVIPPMLVSAKMLARQLEWVGRRFTFVPLDDLAARLERGDGSAAACAAVTFDDGYRDVYDYAFPQLWRMGIPAAVFVVTDFIGTRKPPLHDRLYLLLSGLFARWRRHDDRLGQLLDGIGLGAARSAMARDDWSPFAATRLLLNSMPAADLRRAADRLEAIAPPPDGLYGSFEPLTWQMLGEMRRAGMTIGSHTRSHVLLTNETPGRIHDELTTSRAILEQRLNTAVDHFAYPDGMFDATAVQAVAAAGYRSAFTACRHRDPRYPMLTIPRVLLWEGSSVNCLGRFSSAIMRCQVSGIFSGREDCRHAGGARPVEEGTNEAVDVRPSPAPSVVVGAGVDASPVVSGIESPSS
jgi:peptidoglycan/xylan/chitin deacetylase (PgdA/CDA1 family)